MSLPVSGGFQSFQSGCGTCNASKDYADIYYSQSQQGGKKRSTSTKKRSKKRSTSTKKRSTSTKKRSTSTKKPSTTTKKRTTIRKMKKMRGGSKEGESQIQLTEQFIKENLGISFNTIGGGHSLPTQYFGGKQIMESPGLPGIGSGIEERFASVKGGAKKSAVKKSTVKKSAVKKSAVKKSAVKKSASKKKTSTTKKRKSTKKSSKKKTTSKKH
jgi:hypothetical protein